MSTQITMTRKPVSVEPTQDGNETSRGMVRQSTCLKAASWVVAVFLLAILTYRLLPDFDLAIDRLFSSATDPFPAQGREIWQLVRGFMIGMTDGSIAVIIIWMSLATIIPRLQIVRQEVFGFVVLTYAAVPGLLVNGVIKPYWGRARPRNIIDFGGSALFSPPLEISHQCGGSCSFVSGEASALFTMATLIILIFVPSLPARLQKPAIIVTGAVAALGSGLRVIVGAHFVSDVVFAALLSTGITLMLYMLVGLNRFGSPFIIRKNLKKCLR